MDAVAGFETQQKGEHSMQNECLNCENQGLETQLCDNSNQQEEIVGQGWVKGYYTVKNRKPEEKDSGHHCDQSVSSYKLVRKDLYAGRNLENLPALSSRIVRLFLSSTFTGTKFIF